MSEIPKDDAVAPNDPVHPSPFGEDQHSYWVDKRVNLVQLIDEISQRTHQQAAVVLSVVEFDQEITPTNKAVLFVSPKSLPAGDVIAAIAAHVAKADPVPVTQAAPVDVLAEFAKAALENAEVAKVADKLRGGQSLTAAELSGALKALLGISS